MKKSTLAFGLGLAVLVATVLTSRPAEARLIDARAGIRTGGLFGWGTTPNTPDFFERKRGPGLGFDLGVKLLIFDFSVNFTQMFDGNGRNGTFTQFLAGIAIDVPVGNIKFQHGIEKGRSRNIIRPAFAVGFGVGTPEPVKPPLDNAQISDKGLVSHVGLGYEYFISEFLGVGVEGNFGYHYFVGGGTSEMVVAVNQPHSSGYHVAGFANLMFHLGY